MAQTPEDLKEKLKRRGITYWDVARFASVSEAMVWYVVNGRKTSAKVMAASELPVMTPEREVKGTVSWKSIGSRLAQGVKPGP